MDLIQFLNLHSPNLSPHLATSSDVQLTLSIKSRHGTHGNGARQSTAKEDFLMSKLCRGSQVERPLLSMNECSLKYLIG